MLWNHTLKLINIFERILNSTYTKFSKAQKSCLKRLQGISYRVRVVILGQYFAKNEEISSRC